MILTQHQTAKYTKSICGQGMTLAAQRVLGKIGYSPAELKRAALLASDWEVLRERRDHLNEERLRLAREKEEVVAVVERQTRALRENVDELIEDKALKKALLERTRVTVGGVNQVSRRESDVIADNLMLIEGVMAMPSDQKRLLARHGWAEKRLRTVKRGVKQHLRLNRSYTQVNRRKITATKRAKTVFADLEKWLRRAVRLIKCELDVVDPHDTWGLRSILVFPADKDETNQPEKTEDVVDSKKEGPQKVGRAKMAKPTAQPLSSKQEPQSETPQAPPEKNTYPQETQIPLKASTDQPDELEAQAIPDQTHPQTSDPPDPPKADPIQKKIKTVASKEASKSGADAQKKRAIRKAKKKSKARNRRK